ncbi:glycosyltransferase [Streptomyces sp. NPDC047072]|uniref:glycosyltransferase n=1 Tax=Streptomyces sp. NPDC047072 TaxID=3154809 RepID=UPI0033F932E0
MASSRLPSARAPGEAQGGHVRTVLHIAQSSEGGVASFVAGLSAGQCARGDHVVVACAPDSRLSQAAAESGAETVAWRTTAAPGPGVPREVAAVHRIVVSVGPDLVHLHSSKAGLAGRLALRGSLPTVFQPHAWSFEATSGALHWASVEWERMGSRWTHQLVCVSEGEREAGVAAGVRARYSVVPNGVDLDHFAAAGVSAQARARSRLGIDPSTPLVVCVGRLCRQKGQDVLLVAWSRVTDRVPGALLVLVGEGPDHASLEARAPSTVRFTGDVADPLDWYLAADLMVLPSRWEGMALAPLEAMACSCPVVVTDVPGAAESLPAQQRSDALVPPENPGALADSMSRLLTDRADCHRRGELAHDHVCRHHSVRRVVASMSHVYDRAWAAWAAREGG